MGEKFIGHHALLSAVVHLVVQFMHELMQCATHGDIEFLKTTANRHQWLVFFHSLADQGNGGGIARAIQQTSEEELLVEHGALYPALQRLEERGWISAKWGVSSNNRKARFYSLTAAGRKQLGKETSKWKRLSAAIGRILESEEA